MTERYRQVFWCENHNVGVYLKNSAWNRNLDGRNMYFHPVTGGSLPRMSVILTQTCLGTLVNRSLCSCVMKHTLPVRAVVEGSADMMACDFPAPCVSWHLKALPKRLAAFRETQPWFTGRLSSVTFRVGFNDLKGLFQPK